MHAQHFGFTEVGDFYRAQPERERSMALISIQFYHWFHYHD